MPKPMKTKFLFIAFVVTALLQLSAPLKMVYDSEMTERQGTLYRFRTAPVDPNDPFRGKYVALRFNAETLATKDTTWMPDETVYALIEKDSVGFATITRLSRSEPDGDNNYIAATVHYYSQGIVTLNLPFERFYMEESKAPEAEIAYNDYAGKEQKPAYAIVAVKNGHSVLKDVIVDDIPIREYVLRERNRTPQVTPTE